MMSGMIICVYKYIIVSVSICVYITKSNRGWLLLSQALALGFYLSFPNYATSVRSVCMEGKRLIKNVSSWVKKTKEQVATIRAAACVVEGSPPSPMQREMATRRKFGIGHDIFAVSQCL